MRNKRKRFVTSPNFFNQDQEELKEWYTTGVYKDLFDFIENPNEYQNNKSEIHTGSVFMFDKSFTSKYPTFYEMARSFQEAAINGTLGTDPQGRPCLWLDQERVVGELRAHPEDMGTQCTNSKIVRLSSIPGSEDRKIHGYPVEDLEGYIPYLLVADIFDDKGNTLQSNSAELWLEY